VGGKQKRCCALSGDLILGFPDLDPYLEIKDDKAKRR
jgi:hypothetical protein